MNEIVSTYQKSIPQQNHSKIYIKKHSPYMMLFVGSLVEFNIDQ